MEAQLKWDAIGSNKEKKVEFIKKNKWSIFFIIVLVIQCIYMIFWGTQKSGYYVDEFFTYDKAHYISQSTPNRVKLYDADFMEYEKWFPLEDFKNTLTVSREESLLHDSLIYNVNVFVNSLPYMALLHYVEAIFFDGELNWWSAIGLNIVCFIINQILIYSMVRKVFRQQNAALLATALYGFCGMAVSMLVYVRMYMWLTLLVTVFTYFHVLMWNEEKHWKNFIYEICSLPFLYLAFRDSPLPVIYGAVLVGCFFLGLLIRKKWVQAAYYGVPLIGGGAVFAITKTNYVEVFMDPRQALESGTLEVATSGLVESMISLDTQGFIERSINFLHIICRFLFGHFSVMFLYVVTIVVMSFFIIHKKAYKPCKEDKNLGFIIVLMGAVMLFGIASIVFDLEVIRYNSFVFPQLAICLSCIFVYLSMLLDKQKLITIMGCVLVIAEMFFTVTIPRVENLYLEDRDGVIAIRECKGIDSLVVDYHWDDRVMYECLAYADDTTQVMFTSYGSTPYDKLSDELLVWQSAHKDDKIVQDLLDAGYTYVHEIAETHESRVFLCKK